MPYDCVVDSARVHAIRNSELKKPARSTARRSSRVGSGVVTLALSDSPQIIQPVKGSENFEQN